MRRLAEVAKETNTPLEINFLGIREKRHYPNDLFWQVVGEVGAPVTFGMDAHRPEDAGDKRSVTAAMKLVEKYGLNYIGEPTLIPLK
jgi:histidinol-phosphatase (PHP family)